MPGYRETSFVPYDGRNPDEPAIRAFGWVQWTGLALIVLGAAVDIAFVGSAFGWWRSTLGTPMLAMTPILFGSIMINPRRGKPVDQAPELAAARRKWMAIVIAICAVILGTATIFAMKGY